jgi:hypothetical protein
MAAFAILRLLWSIADCVALDVSVLQQPVLPLDITLLLQYMLSVCILYLWVSSTVQQSVLRPRRCLFCSSFCFSWMYLFNSSLCYARRWPTAVCGAPGLSVYQSQCCTETCLPTRAFVCTQGVCRLYRAVLHLCVSVYKSFVLHLKVSVFKSQFCTCACLLSTRACAAPVLICLQEFCAAPGRVCLQESSVCYT